MTKYDSLNRRRVSQPKPSGPHPIWNGIGCLMMLIIPVIALGFASITMDAAVANRWPVPGQFFGYWRPPELLYKSQILVPMLNAIARVPNLNGYAAFTGLYTIVLGGLLSVVYAVAYRFIGPPTYGPMDVPPPRSSNKRYKR
jgi:hypothetical protein